MHQSLALLVEVDQYMVATRTELRSQTCIRHSCSRLCRHAMAHGGAKQPHKPIGIRCAPDATTSGLQEHNLGRLLIGGVHHPADRAWHELRRHLQPIDELRANEEDPAPNPR